MAGVRDEDLQTLAGFPAGVNNTADLTEAPRDKDGNVIAARELVNLDLDATGKPRRKRGRVREREGVAHSLHGTDTHLFAVIDGDLRAFTDSPAGLVDAATLIAGLGPRFVSYATDDFDTWWGNGERHGRIDAELGLHPFWPGTPDPVGLTASDSGALGGGTFEVSVTVLDADGRESGASPPVALTLTTGQGLAVTLPAPPEDAAQWRVYRSTPDGEVLYHAKTLPIAATTVVLGHQALGEPLETAWLFPMPPCDVLRYGHNRFFGLQGRNVLWWTEPYTGLVRDTNYLLLGAEATLLEVVGEGGDGAGLFVADHKRTYFMAGADPAAWRQIGRYPHAAVPGTSLTVPGTVFGLDIEAPVAFWLARNGTFCIGVPGGQVLPQLENALAMPLDSERGAAAFFAFDGIRQIVTSVLAGLDNPLALSDSASATVRSYGITL